MRRKKAYHHLTHAPDLEAQIKFIYATGLVRGFIYGVVTMIIGGVIVRLMALPA